MVNLHKHFLMMLGKSIREKREKMGISQEQLGKLANCHRTYVGMVERGEKNITVLNMQKFAQALGVPLRDLIDF